jgi:hypothetical protein
MDNERQFAVLDSNNIVRNTIGYNSDHVGITTFNLNVSTVDSEDIAADVIINLGLSRAENVMVSGDYNLLQFYSNGELETKNDAIIHGTYFPEFDAFAPPKENYMDETWIFNTETYKWEPNPEITYNIIDNIPHKWNPETDTWYRVEE